jgi:hypothetical protein
MGESERCACGQPLHYSDSRIQRVIEDLIAAQGPEIPVTVRGRTWLVPQHYIALHGLKAWELPTLGFSEVDN